MKIRINKGTAAGTVCAPPSKSMSHRLLILAAMCDGVSTVRGISDCDDVLATLDCLKALGVKHEQCGNAVTVHGKNPKEMHAAYPLNCRESGSTLRFLIPVAMLKEQTTVFRVGKTLASRPMSVYESLFCELGLTYIGNEEDITVSGQLNGGEFTIPGNVSSQFISGLLLALPAANEDSTIRITPPIESRSYMDMTVDALKSFGVNAVWLDEYTISIRGKQKYTPCDITVEGDYSGAAFLEALSLFGADVRIDGLCTDTKQGDRAYKDYYEMLTYGAPTINIADCPDLGPILFAVAAAKNGGVFTGTHRLKTKESDRARAMAEELRKFGASVTVDEDAVIVRPKALHAPSEPLCGHNDHRIVMALSILLTLTGGEIDGAEAVSKSYPAFFEDLTALGIEVTAG